MRHDSLKTATTALDGLDATDPPVDKIPGPIWINVSHDEYENMFSKCHVSRINEKIILQEGKE